jgi:hypothetical protein
MTVSSSDTPTVRMRAIQRVVLVRDGTRPWRPFADSLMNEFAVRLATSATDMIEHLSPRDRLACICVVTDSIRMRDIHAALVLAGIEPERIVVVGADDLASPARVDEVLRVVRRFGATTRGYESRT